MFWNLSERLLLSCSGFFINNLDHVHNCVGRFYYWNQLEKIMWMWNQCDRHTYELRQCCNKKHKVHIYIDTYAKLLTCIVRLRSSFTGAKRLLWFIWKNYIYIYIIYIYIYIKLDNRIYSYIFIYNYIFLYSKCKFDVDLYIIIRIDHLL